MEEKTIARHALNAFHEENFATLKEICSEYLVQRLTYLGNLNHSQNELYRFIWDGSFDFQTKKEPQALVEAIQVGFNSYMESDQLFQPNFPKYRILDPATRLCFIPTQIPVISSTIDMQDSEEVFVTVVLIKEEEYWRYHNLVGFSLSNKGKGWFYSFEEAVDFSNLKGEQREHSDSQYDQLNSDDYWGSDTSEEVIVESETNISRASTQTSLNYPQSINASSTASNLWPEMAPSSERDRREVNRTKSTKTTEGSVKKEQSDAAPHIMSLLKNTYGLAKLHGLSKIQFESMVRVVLKEEK